MNVKRYNLVTYGLMEEDNNGDYIKYEDYESLQDEIDTLKEKLIKLKDMITDVYMSF